MLQIPNAHLDAFERALDPANPEACSITAQILGYGEMSTVLTFPHPDYEKYAFKRMALFRTHAEIDAYEQHYRHYNEALTRFGICLPDYGTNRIPDASNQPILYLSQERLDGRCIGNKVLHLLPQKDALLLLYTIQKTALTLFLHNHQILTPPQSVTSPKADSSPRANTTHATAGAVDYAAMASTHAMAYGLDMQISNWAVRDFDPEHPRFVGDETLVYIDTSTPLIRIDGREQLDPELFLRICPSYLVWIIRWLFLADVMNRYYDYRLVVLDLIANLYKERRTDIIDAAIAQANAFFANEAHALGCVPLTPKEIQKYYKEDAFLWRIFLAFRRFERFIKTKIQRKRYNIILPGKIKR